jgi:hypothetical protein
MDTSLRMFLREFLGVVLATLIPVILTAFMTMPYILQGHPGEKPLNEVAVLRHLT